MENFLQSTLIVQYGISEQLKAEFDMLREVPCSDGSRKFSEKSVRKLAQHIVCRHYANICYEFAHLTWAIVNSDVEQYEPQLALLDYFWVQEIRSKAGFIDFFTHRLGVNASFTPFNGASIEVNDAQLYLNINQHEFAINANRANLFSCLMEWLIACVPNLLEKVESTLLSKGSNAISEFASQLQKQIYQYLGEHLPSVKLQQRYRLLGAWYEQKEAEVSFDQSMFDFWQHHNSVEGFGKFSNTLKDTFTYFNALEIGQTSTQLHFAQNIDSVDYQLSSRAHQNLESAQFTTTTWQEEGWHSQVHFAHAQTISEQTIDISLLTNVLKVMNKHQQTLLHLLCECGQDATKLPASYIRNCLFGKLQHQIIQATRNRSIGNRQQIERLIEQDYQAIKIACVSANASNLQALLAIVHILIEEQCIEDAMSVLVKLSKQLPSLLQHHQALLNLLDNEHESEQIRLQDLKAWQLSKPWFMQLLNDCKTAYKHINRKGFTENTRQEAQIYIDCAEHLFALNLLVKALLKKAEKNKVFDEENFQADRFIFLNEFSKLYLHNDDAQ